MMTDPGTREEPASPPGAGRRRSDVAVLALAALPLLVALVALAGRRWFPVLDLAMTELRIRDVGTRHTPLIGLPGRIGTFPDQGSHPGPLSFWLLAPVYRVTGASAWSMEAATVVLQLCWISLAGWIAHRRLGGLGVLLGAAVVAVLVRGFGLTVLVQPWNPYLPLLAWLVVLLAAWSVVSGDSAMLIPLTVACTFVAQTHIPYLVLAGAIGVAGTVVVLVRAWQSEDRRSALTPVAWSAGLFAVLWVGPLVDQVRRDPGNVTRLIDHFTTPDEDTRGLVAGLELLLRHLDVVQAHGGLLTGTGSFLEAGFDPDGPIWPGVLVLVVWITAAVGSVVLDRRRGTSSARSSLHAVIAVAMVLGLLSMMRIFGKPWYYLTLWAWVTTTLLVVATLWTAWAWMREGTPSRWGDADSLRYPLVGVAVVASLATTVAAFDTDHPEERLGATVGELVAPTADALRDGVGPATGPGGRYVVKWTDAAFFGSQGYTLISELERVGLDVGAYATWSVPVTAHRVIPFEETTAEVILATGINVEMWRTDDRVVEVAAVDPRSAEERREFDTTRQELIDALRADDLDDLVPFVDSNLFGVLVDPRLPPSSQELVDRLLYLGQETAVFLGAPGVAP
jgi:hypothetical protein